MSTAPATSVSAVSAAAEGADVPPYRYTAELAGRIERRWQERWAAEGTFHTPNPTGDLAGENAALAEREKLFVMDMFPYPSGSGLHVGHPLGFIATDVFTRFQRMNGRNVLHTMGFDAFGLPAEQYAIQTGQHPRKTTEDNITVYRRQLRLLGLSHDERRSVATIEPEFFRWTQWIFREIFESWYDVAADGGAGRARPITELVAEFEAGTRTPPGGVPWAELSEVDRRRLIDDHRLAYRSDAPVNWCPGLGTVLANEEVTADGRSERGNFPVFKRKLTQWMMRITAYADRLIDDLDRLDWPEPIKIMQRNWIGRSTGATVHFAIDGGTDGGADGDRLSVFTTRPDTLFGATYMVVAPEHPLLTGGTLVPADWPADVPAGWTGGYGSPAEAVAAYQEAAAAKSEEDRTADSRTKTGVFTGSYAVNPVNGGRIPIFAADYVLMGYGTGAIMAVPGQDQRDWDFATAYDLPIIRTVEPPAGFDGQAYAGEGVAINSANNAGDHAGENAGDDAISLNGLPIAEAKARIIAWLTERGFGEGTVQYKLRDWLFSRQRYWGEPFPIVYDEHDLPISLPVDMLPVELPEVDNYSPRTFEANDPDTAPEPPLGRATDWVTVELDLGDGPKKYRRELNTMPNWAGSCWYHLRYLDPTNAEKLVDPDIERYWMGPRSGDGSGVGATAGDPGGVDLYVGGQEHAVLHLLYARFWHKVLFDLGYVSSSEPYRKLINQGYIQAYAYTDSRGSYVPAEEVIETESGGYEFNGQPVRREYGKMGKSLKNVVTPNEMCDTYGADTFRLYEMSTGPLESSRPWETRAVIGPHRFLQRVWRLVVDENTGDMIVGDSEMDDETLRLLHRTIAGVRADYGSLKANTAAAKLIELCNRLTAVATAGPVPRAAVEPLVRMMAPLTPHVAEELWSKLGHADSLTYEPFPVADESLVVAETVTYPIQVNGKVRGRITIEADADQDAVLAAALAADGVASLVEGRELKKSIVVPGRIVTLVVG